ncbi:uncharacterized protein ACIBXB_022264 [Morphnus guianensis]
MSQRPRTRLRAPARRRVPREVAGQIPSPRGAPRPGTIGPASGVGAADGAPCELVHGKPSSRAAALTSALQSVFLVGMNALISSFLCLVCCSVQERNTNNTAHPAPSLA